MSELITIQTTGDDSTIDDSVIKIVKKSGETGHVYLPKSWIGKPVKIIQLDITPRSFLDSILGETITNQLIGKKEESQ